MTKVIFRKARGGDVVAFFPQHAGDTNYSRTCLSYAHVGQHGAASLDYARECRPATPAEVKPLYRELVSIGYSDLSIRRRFTRADHEARKQECKE